MRQTDDDHCDPMSELKEGAVIHKQKQNMFKRLSFFYFVGMNFLQATFQPQVSGPIHLISISSIKNFYHKTHPC